MEAEDEGTNFIPSRVVPSQLLPNYNPQLRYSLPSLVSDSTFGVSVTPISIDKVVLYSLNFFMLLQPAYHLVQKKMNK